MSWCGGRDLNPRTTKDKALNLAPLTRLDYPRALVCNEDTINKLYHSPHTVANACDSGRHSGHNLFTRPAIMMGREIVASPSTVTLSAVSFTFPHETASLTCAPESEPWNSCAVVK